MIATKDHTSRLFCEELCLPTAGEQDIKGAARRLLLIIRTGSDLRYSCHRRSIVLSLRTRNKYSYTIGTDLLDVLWLPLQPRQHRLELGATGRRQRIAMRLVLHQ